MFTVKHIFHADPTGPHIENLYSADEVQFNGTDGSDPRGALQLRSGGEITERLWGGVAYAMNEAGKTVGTYDLPRFDGKDKSFRLDGADTTITAPVIDSEDYAPGSPEHYDNVGKV